MVATGVEIGEAVLETYLFVTVELPLLLLLLLLMEELSAAFETRPSVLAACVWSAVVLTTGRLVLFSWGLGGTALVPLLG